MNKIRKCCLCGKLFFGWGNNPQPLKDKGECCDACNCSKVIPARLQKIITDTSEELKQEIEEEVNREK